MISQLSLPGSSIQRLDFLFSDVEIGQLVPVSLPMFYQYRHFPLCSSYLTDRSSTSATHVHTWSYRAPNEMNL